MRENKEGSVLVTVNGTPTGICTERDILYKIAAEDLPAVEGASKEGDVRLPDNFGAIGYHTQRRTHADGQTSHKAFACNGAWGTNWNREPTVGCGRSIPSSQRAQVVTGIKSSDSLLLLLLL